MDDPWAPRLTVDLDALAGNYGALKAQAGEAQTAPVVKADAYGLGAGPVARRLWREGARRFFVARIAEGEALRKALGASRPAVITVLDGCPAGAEGRLVAADLEPALCSVAQVLAWRHEAPDRPFALHVDTGMNRLGLARAEAEAVARSLSASGAGPELVMSHLACSSEPSHPMNAAQRDAFLAVRRLFPRAQASLANTDGVFLGPAYRFDLVRPGIGLYGGGPGGRSGAPPRAVATLEAPILQVRRLASGETVGYGAEWRAPRPTVAAVIAAGFADGVLRALGGGGYGWLGGQARPFIGRLSMDLIALDVTDCDEARDGAMVELLGPNVELNEVARLANTVPYEILARPSPRFARRLTGDA